MHIQCNSEKGQSVNFSPKNVIPFGILDLWNSISDSSASYDLKFEVDDYVLDGEIRKGDVTINTTVNFNEQPFPFALVPGGWLPMPLAMPPKFLVDRNVVANLRKLRNKPLRKDLQAFHWWFQFFNKGESTFNPLPYAWESSFRRKPSISEFFISFEEGASEIRTAFPMAQVVTFDVNQYPAVYQIVEACESRAKKEAEFLCSICPLLAMRIPNGREKGIVEKLILNAKRIGICLNSLVFITTLSCLFEDQHGKIFPIGRRILKLKPKYGPKEAFNALSDIRHIEFAVAGQACFPENSFSLSTCDYGLASLWCALSPKSSNGMNGKLTFDLTEELFPRLAATEILQMENLIRG